MIEDVGLIKKEIVRIENEIDRYKRKINKNKVDQEMADHSCHVFTRLIRELESGFSDYLAMKRRKTSKFCCNKFERKYFDGLKQVINSSPSHKMMSKLDESAMKTKKIITDREEEIYQWKSKIVKLEEELRMYKSALTQLGG